MAEAKPWKTEYAKSNRSTCNTCKSTIAKDEFRIARMVQATRYDGLMATWHHAACILKNKKKIILSVDDVEGFESLRLEDQKRLRNYVEGSSDTADGEEEDDEANATSSSAPSGSKHAIESAKSSRAACKECKEKISKGEVRVSTSAKTSKTSAWRHIECFLKLGWCENSVETLTGWDKLSPEEQQSVLDLQKSLDDAKPKRKADSEPEASTKRQKKEMSDTEKEFERQTNALWELKDELKVNLATSELKEMLEANDLDTSGSDIDLRERCADGMMFGALKHCPNCEGFVAFQGGQYKCGGFMSAWSKCTYITLTPERVNDKWKIPKGTKNKFLRQWYKNQKTEKEARVLLPQSSKSEADGSRFLRGLDICMTGRLKKTQTEWTKLIEEAGGSVTQNIHAGTSCVVTREDAFEKENAFLEEARSKHVPVVGENFLIDCMEKKSNLSTRNYVLEGTAKMPTVSKVKVKGRSAVHEDSNLQDTAHILEVGQTVYNVTLNCSDLSKGTNSYYILQIIQEDKGDDCYVFRKWGRVGSATIGGQTGTDNPMTKDDAIREFKRLFLEKTGNNFSVYGTEDFEKRPGKFYPLEIDYGVDDDGPQKGLAEAGSRSKLHPRVVGILKMLFNIETYRAAMLEFEINPAQMPLGKLSKRHIQRGFEVLTEIQDILREQSPQAESQLLDASNRFFTLIPSTSPVAIRDDEALQSKIQMLEALRDMEIASQFINDGSGTEDEDPLDSKYKKLNCEISPLPHDSAEFEMVKKYLHRTHAPTHRDWALELEDVLVVNRSGEEDAYSKFRSSLKNHMLLWHGSRTTNFVGILSQGLRIAPPEAPVTGYMFGKGVYFADLVSKSAQYCFTTRANPTGLMLLSEVALGDMNELTGAKYMDKPPRGCQSTKGLGKTIPDPSESEVIENGVVVPCGRPVFANIRSDLLYNEYIVYDTAQVRLKYLLKVQFKHKR